MSTAARPALLERPGGRKGGGRVLPVMLRLKGGFTVLKDAHGIVLRDSHRPNRPAYFSDLEGVLHEVFKRQINRRLIKDQRKDLAALREAIESARAELEEVLSMKEVTP